MAAKSVRWAEATPKKATFAREQQKTYNMKSEKVEAGLTVHMDCAVQQLQSGIYVITIDVLRSVASTQG